MRRSLLALVLGLWACSAPQAPPGPTGLWWVGERPAVEALLGQLEALAGTPLGSWASRLEAELPAACPLLGAHAPDGDLAALGARVDCVGEGELLATALARARKAGDAGRVDLAFGHAGGQAGELRGALRVAGADLELGVDWSGVQVTGALALLIPGDREAGPDRLATRGRLLHARVRPAGGIDLSALAPPESQADRLFHLRSGLFESTVLDGTWELALYESERPGALPATALALGVRSALPARAAAEHFLADLAETWSVAQSPIEVPAGAGACLLELAVLPELAPCYVATEDTLVVAWNPRALERALGGEAQTTASKDSTSARLELNLERVARSDALAAQRLAEQQGVDARVIDWPWRRLEASAERRNGALHIDARLAARDGAS